MHRRRFLTAAGLAGTGVLAGCAGRSSSDASDPSTDAAAGLHVEPVAEGFTHPWSLAFLPDDGALVTERPGGLSLLDRSTGAVQPVDGVPTVDARGQGGLLDVAPGPAFAETDLVYLTYAAANDSGATTTHVGRGRLDREAARLEAFEALHAARPFVDSTGHYGSRLAFDDDRLYVTVGDRQFKNFGPDHVAQRLDTELGVVLRLEADGSIPDDNPFVDDPAARDAIYSYGHRNPQGLTIHPETGALFESEYGEQDGDEINVLEAGANYGWPVADNSCKYGSDEPVGVPHEARSDVVAPVYGWECGSGGFPPSGAAFYEGDAFPDWRGDLFVAGLAKRYLARFSVDGREVTEAGALLADREQRIRDVAVAPVSGHLYAAVDDGDAPILRIAPRE